MVEPAFDGDVQDLFGHHRAAAVRAIEIAHEGRTLISIVLDTSCVRGTPRAALRGLVRRGFSIQISGLAFGELSVRLRQPPSTAEIQKEQQVIRARVGFLSELLGHELLFAPTHDHLVDKLGGYRRGAPPISSYSKWLTDTREGWKSISENLSMPPGVAAQMDNIAAYVELTGADFVRSTQAAADFGPSGTRGRSRGLEQMLEEMIDEDVVSTIVLPGPPTATKRFDAHSRLRALHFQGGRDRAIGEHGALTENHAIDLNMLQHLADGLVVVTSDYELVEDVDRSGTQQAAWVRTVGELLAGRIPLGPPFGLRARRAAAKHRLRKREELKRLDDAGLVLAKAEE